MANTNKRDDVINRFGSNSWGMGLLDFYPLLALEKFTFQTLFLPEQHLGEDGQSSS